MGSPPAAGLRAVAFQPGRDPDKMFLAGGKSGGSGALQRVLSGVKRAAEVSINEGLKWRRFYGSRPDVRT